MTKHLPAIGAGPRDVAVAVNQTINGKLNSTGTVTLNAGATSTTISNPLVTKDSFIDFRPQTANAAAIANPYVLRTNITEGASFIITHANDANADKIFAYVILG